VSDWNFADLWEVVARQQRNAPALIQGARVVSWAELDRRADAVAAALLDAGLGRQGKVAQYLYNGPEYLESLFAAMKAGGVPVNTNYRYTAAELVYLWDNADAEVVVFDADFAERVDAVRDRLPRVRLWLQVGGERVPSWARRYEHVAAASADGPVRAPWGRSGDDLLLIYTGGTTGLPKGVMWRQSDLFVTLNRRASLRFDPDAGPEAAAAVLAAPRRHPPTRLLPGPPLMHGTGLFTAMSVLDTGGRVVMPEGRHFEPIVLLDTVEREAVTEMSIVGDAFARPILAALDAEPDRWDLSSLWLMVSSGVMWSAEVKAGLARHLPRLVMVDSLGSSEAIDLASSRSTAGATSGTAGFTLGPATKVIDEDGVEVVPGSGERGLVALRGHGPIGYYKDAEKSAATFRRIDGERWTVPGDWATVDADGTVKLLGRGSVVVNTGGEKVFPEEVEEVLKLHPAVLDAVVVGLPDERFGEVVVAVVQPSPGVGLDAAALPGWLHGRLAGYKVPRRVVAVETIGRAPNGKVDYRRLRAEAADALGVPRSD
jgi:acyl-CoA synthetase (AMP-forming)/AMP-acid ligase II